MMVMRLFERTSRCREVAISSADGHAIIWLLPASSTLIVEATDTTMSGSSLSFLSRSPTILRMKQGNVKTFL